jgi:hypothetical protein
MNFKIHLTYTLLALGLVMFSNQAVNAQNGSAQNINSEKLNFAFAANQINFSLYNSTFSLDSTKHLESKEFYLNKSKKQKTEGWYFLGIGTTFIIVGTIGFVNETNKTPNDVVSGVDSFLKAGLFGAVILGGIVSDLISVPFFISSSQNKKMAAILSFGNQHIYSPFNKSICRNAYPSLTLKIQL